MSKSYHQHKSTSVNNQTTSTALAFDTSPTAGRSIAVFITGNHASGYQTAASTPVTDSQGNTYSLVADTGVFGIDSRDRMYCYAAHGITGGAITVTVSHLRATTNYVGLVIIEFSATGAVSTDKTGTAYDNYTVDIVNGLTATASAANDDAAALVFGFSAWQNDDGTITGTRNSSGFTDILTSLTATGYRQNAVVSYKVASGSETSSFKVTLNDNAANQGCMVVTFKEAAGTTKYLKALISSAAAGASSVSGTVFEAPIGGAVTGAKIGEFTGGSFLGTNSLDGGKAKLLINVSSFGGSSLTTANTPHVYLRTSSFDTGIFPATVIEV